MSVTSFINNEELTLVQGTGGLFFCEESWVMQKRRDANKQKNFDKEYKLKKNGNSNKEYPQAGFLDLLSSDV